MATNVRELDLHSARMLIADRSLCADGVTGRVGLESEWHVTVDGAPSAVAPLALLHALLPPWRPLRGGSTITYEPGGQVELSGPALPSVEEAAAAMTRDLHVVRASLARHGLTLVGTGVDAVRPPRRLLHASRYDAMEAYFDAHGSHGRTMMTRTASVQVNLDAGRGEDLVARWRRVHAIGPTLVAAFANSPIAAGVPSGWRSTRLANWFVMDRTRTAPVGPHPADWIDYALDARVMLIRIDDERFVPLRDGLTMRAWIERGHELGWPTADDLVYHLTTLFPPVRPRGWFEVRYLDALPVAWWPVAAAVTAMLVDDETAAAVGDDACASTDGRWLAAARDGLTDPDLALSARRCFAAAIDALDRRGLAPDLVERCQAYADRYVARGRCPADDALDGARMPVAADAGRAAREPSWT